MTKEQIIDFNRRISTSKRSELVVVMYDIFFAYLDDARAAENHEDYKGAILSAQAVLDRLMKTLNFDYEVSYELFALYQYAMRQLSTALYRNQVDELIPAEHVMGKLYVSFAQIVAADDSAPLMENAERVVAGMTYGRGSLVDYVDSGANRGFLV